MVRARPSQEPICLRAPSCYSLAMRISILVFSALLLTACATTNDAVFEGQYSGSEIAEMTSEHFDVLEADARAALKPAFKKYGAPHAYIDGLMSSVDMPKSNHLYGSGNFKTKVSLDAHTFWRINGDNLAGHLAPVKTAHLVYEAMRLDPLSKELKFTETLTKRGQKFTVFERKVDNDIVITIHKSDELPQSTFETISFFNE